LRRLFDLDCRHVDFAEKRLRAVWTRLKLEDELHAKRVAEALGALPPLADGLEAVTR
jgi:hypothetical protein